jgi:hypothetical protein
MTLTSAPRRGERRRSARLVLGQAGRHVLLPGRQRGAAQPAALPHLEAPALLHALPPGGARSHCRFAPPHVRFTPDSRTHSVPLFLKRRCARTPPPGRARAAALHALQPGHYMTQPLVELYGGCQGLVMNPTTRSPA